MEDQRRPTKHITMDNVHELYGADDSYISFISAWNERCLPKKDQVNITQMYKLILQEMKACGLQDIFAMGIPGAYLIYHEKLFFHLKQSDQMDCFEIFFNNEDNQSSYLGGITP